VTEMEDRGTDSGFELDDFTFGSKAELRKFLVDEKVASVGQFWDLFSVMVVMEPKRMTGKEVADNRYSADRVSTTTLENDLAASMSHEQPALLFGTTGGHTAPADEGLAACGSYGKWIGKGCESYKQKLGKLLRNYTAGIRGTLTTGGRGNALVRSLLSAVQDQWNSLVAFIDTFHQELVEVAKFTPGKAYLLIGRCVRAVFETMVPYRASVSLLSDPGLLENKAAYIWSVLQCHRILQGFMSVEWRGHPSIVKELGLFTLTERVDPTEVSELIVRTHAAEASANKAQKELKEMKDGYGVFKREFGQLKEELRVLKLKTKNL
jgi:hypothetical protein